MNDTISSGSRGTAGVSGSALTPPTMARVSEVTASPLIRLPNVPFASVYLGWDGGPDHPNPDVWVSVNNAPEISAALLYGPVLKQPRIPSVELKLQGGLYKFFLKDAEAILSTVTVVIP